MPRALPGSPAPPPRPRGSGRPGPTAEDLSRGPRYISLLRIFVARGPLKGASPPAGRRADLESFIGPLQREILECARPLALFGLSEILECVVRRRHPGPGGLSEEFTRDVRRRIERSVRRLASRGILVRRGRGVYALNVPPKSLARLKTRRVRSKVLKALPGRQKGLDPYL